MGKQIYANTCLEMKNSSQFLVWHFLCQLRKLQTGSDILGVSTQNSVDFVLWINTALFLSYLNTFIMCKFVISELAVCCVIQCWQNIELKMEPNWTTGCLFFKNDDLKSLEDFYYLVFFGDKCIFGSCKMATTLNSVFVNKILNGFISTEIPFFAINQWGWVED